MNSKSGSRYQNLGIFFLFVAFLGMRLYHLGYNELWYDEIISIDYIKYPLHNWNPPLFYILSHFVVMFLGITEFSVRLVSAIFGFFSLVVLYKLGKKLFSEKTAVLAVVTMGLSPINLWYAQEARNYSLVVFIGILASYILVCIVNSRDIKLWIAYIAVCAAGMYSNYFFVFVFFAHAVYVALFAKEIRKIYFSCVLLSILLFLPYIKRFLLKFSVVNSGFWIPEPNLNSIRITVENFVLGYNAHPRAYIAVDALIIILLVASIMLFLNGKYKNGLVFCAFMFLVPIIVAFIFSRLFFSVYIDRGILIAAPYLYMLLGAGMEKTGKKVAPVFFLLLIYGVFAYYSNWMFTPVNHHIGTYIKKPVSPVVDFVEENFKAGDILAMSNDNLEPGFRFYGSRQLKRYYFFDPQLQDTTWKTDFKEGEFHKAKQNIGKLSFNALWFVGTNWARDGNLCENSSRIKEWLDSNFHLKLAKEIEGSWVFAYER